jgi:hypothetical protein
MSDGFFESTAFLVVNITHMFELRKANNVQGNAGYGLKNKVCLFLARLPPSGSVPPHSRGF